METLVLGGHDDVRTLAVYAEVKSNMGLVGKLTGGTYEESNDVYEIGKRHDPNSSHINVNEDVDGVWRAYTKYIAPE